VNAWRVAVRTSVGVVRSSNQDAHWSNDSLVVVADGMGGHAAGEVASAIAVSTIAEAFAGDQSSEGLRRAVVLCNDRILKDAELNPERHGMGTTAVALGLVSAPDGLLPVIANLGDSRAYQIRDGAIRLITADHSVAEEWFRQGRISAQEAAVHPRRHQLTRALGIAQTPDVDLFPMAVQPTDIILLCSDGLTNEVSETEIIDIVEAAESLEDAASELVSRAEANGGRDNITVALVEILGPMSQPLATSPAAVTSAATPPPRARTRRVTWRLGAALAALGAVLAGAVVVLGWYANSSYYLAADGAYVAVYRGQPHGLLWFAPTEIMTTDFLAAQLRPADVTALGNDIVEPSLAAAIHYAGYLHSAWLMSQFSTPSTPAG